MAENDQDLELDVEGKKGGGKMIIIIIVVLVLAGGGAAAFFLLGGDDKPASEGGPNANAPAVELKQQEAIYVGVPETVMAPVRGTKKDRLVQIKVSLLVRSSESEDEIKKHMPRIKNNLLELVSQQNAEEVITPEGRRELQERALAVVQETMTEASGNPHVEKVLFVSFVMQ